MERADEKVMMVRHTQTAKIHAMKAISKRSVLTFDELGHTMTEARILKYFAKYDPHNPFVVKLDYSFTDRENIYFVMDFYPGQSSQLFAVYQADM
jgi:serine/threonine protein kinase